jgi:hypothetical protein
MNLFEKIAKEKNKTDLVNVGLGATTLGGLGTAGFYGYGEGIAKDISKKLEPTLKEEGAKYEKYKKALEESEQKLKDIKNKGNKDFTHAIEAEAQKWVVDVDRKNWLSQKDKYEIPKGLSDSALKAAKKYGRNAKLGLGAAGLGAAGLAGYNYFKNN